MPNRRIVPDADCPIRFSVSGGGTIAGTANGDPASHESNVAARRTSFHGLCLVVVRAANRPGTIMVEAQRAGNEARKIEITGAKMMLISRRRISWLLDYLRGG